MANKNSTAKKLDLSVLKKFNFAKFKRFKGVQIVSKIAIYFFFFESSYVKGIK